MVSVITRYGMQFCANQEVRCVNGYLQSAESLCSTSAPGCADKGGRLDLGGGPLGSLRMGSLIVSMGERPMCMLCCSSHKGMFSLKHGSTC